MIAPNNQKTISRIGLCLLIAMAMAMAAAYEVTAGYGNASLTKLIFCFISICMEVEGIPRVGLVSAIIKG